MAALTMVQLPIITVMAGLRPIMAPDTIRGITVTTGEGIIAVDTAMAVPIPITVIKPDNEQQP